MGEQKVSILQNEASMHRFVQHLLDDVQALQHMLDNNYFENKVTRIGAEQEMCLVDNKAYKPATKAMEALDKMKNYDWVETELAKFNLETNLTPRLLKGKCFSKMEQENVDKLNKIRAKLKTMDTRLILTGILPTLRKFHLEMDNLTPMKRYYALMESINRQLIGSSYELRLNGVDELLVKHDSPLLEACNTSFQFHLQVAPENFVQMYNISQLVAAPVMAIAANSPIVFGRRLWHESRIALFQQSIDTRSSHQHMRERSPRVNFGSRWIKGSIMDIYREDIARFRVLLSSDVKEESIKMIQKGLVPKLRALQVHNSTVYRWNRPCYGISPNGKPHLRIENRVLPAGPTVLDEMANGAFWVGLMIGMAEKYEDVSKHIGFANVRDNFEKAARVGLDAQFTWFKDKKYTVSQLVIKELLPIARAGLEKMKVDSADINRYLDVIHQRAKLHMNGARWQLRAYTKLMEETTRHEAITCLTAAIINNQEKEIPVHKWKLPELSDLSDYRPNDLLIEEFMCTDIITAQKNDIVELVAEMMDYKGIRFAPVEDKNGKLVGLVTSKQIINYLLKHKSLKGKRTTVQDIMQVNPATVTPRTNIKEAMRLMRTHKIGCLPVVEKGELVGVITEMDFLRISRRLLEQLS